MTASNWGTTKGEAQSNKVDYMKFNAGENRIRIVGDILRRYVYWVPGATGKQAPFENLDFNRDTESFENGGQNPVKELGLFETKYGTSEVVMQQDKRTGEWVKKPLGSKKAYLTQVINRATNQVEYMEVKKGIFDGICEVMGKIMGDPKTRKRFINPDYEIKDPSGIDIIFTKSGKGLDTEYKVDLISTLDLLQDEDEFTELMSKFEADKALLKDLKPIDEVFPRQTYAEQKAALDKWVNGSAEESEEDSTGGEAAADTAAQEAMDELDD